MGNEIHYFYGEAAEAAEVVVCVYSLLPPDKSGG